MTEPFDIRMSTWTQAGVGPNGLLEETIFKELLSTCNDLDTSSSDPWSREKTDRIRDLASELNWLARRTAILVGAALRLVESSLPLDAIEVALDDAAALVGAERGFMLLYAASGEAFDRIENPRLGKLDANELSIAEKLATEVYSTDFALLNPNVAIDPRFSFAPGIAAYSTRSTLIVPVSVEAEGQKERIGVIYLDRPSEKRIFSEQDCNLLQSFSSLVALSIRNVRLTVDLRLAYQDTVQALVKALEAKDSSTRGHSVRVSEYAVRCAKRFRLGMQRLEILRSAALLHDIGKIGIRDEILRKPGHLTRDEFDHVKTHPEISETILKGLRLLTQEMTILRQHHERYDGTGYPHGLKGDQISLEGAIIQVADSWDAMTSQRVYHHEMTIDEALDELRRSSGHQFNPKVVDVFVKMVQEEGLVELEETPSE